MVNFEIKDAHFLSERSPNRDETLKLKMHIFCPNDLQIATKHFDSRESEFPRTTQNVLLIRKFTINSCLDRDNLLRHLYLNPTCFEQKGVYDEIRYIFSYGSTYRICY